MHYSSIRQRVEFAQTFAVAVAVGTLIVSASLMPLARARRGQITLTAIDDAYVNSANSGSNYGERTFLRVAKWQYSSAVLEERVWLKFDLSAIPVGSFVDNATLQMHTILATASYIVHAHSCSNISWTESSLTYSNQPSYNATSMNSTTVSDNNKWYDWKVIYAVRNAMDTQTNAVTIMLCEPTLRGLLTSVDFDSKEAGGASAPRLMVDYSTPVPEFPSQTPMVLLVIVTLTAVLLLKRYNLPRR